MSTATHISVKALAARWGVNAVAIYRQVQDGRIAALHIGQVIRIPITEVERFEAENTTGLGVASSRRRSRSA